MSGSVPFISSVLATSNAKTTRTIGQLGFQYNPFQHLEASTDPHLASYLIDHPGSALVWDDLPTILFAPPGGGKTAFQISAMRMSWVGYGNQHSFPIPLILSRIYKAQEQHVQIAQSAARVLLIALAAQPELLNEVAQMGQYTIARFLDATLPYSLNMYARMFATNPPLSTITRHLDYRYQLPTRTAAPDLSAIVRLLNTAIPKTYQADDLFSVTQHILLEIFGFRSITLHIDGVDGDAIASPSVQTMWNIIAYALENIDLWQQQSIILKAYVPEELRLYLDSSNIRSYQVIWNKALLADLISSRIYQASAGAFGSFDAIASRELSNIEDKLAETVVPLPREIIFLAQLVLGVLSDNDGTQGPRVTPSVLEEAIKIYSHQANSTAFLVEV